MTRLHWPFASPRSRSGGWVLLGLFVIANAQAATIWPSTSAPSQVDAGPDSAVELGVKFQSDVVGSITGIRFYKATANTNTHLGHLWTSTGTLLGSVTFTNETASGWQQMLFAAPVAIASNTVYVASYHTLVGHYSEDDNYFLSKGVNNPPLHALTNGVSGGNGVYAYGTTNVFPSQTYNSANYWVDVVFQPTLLSIAVTPANPTILTRATQQFTATGTYSDQSTSNLTGLVTWTSSSTAVATIDAGGLATAVSAGTTSITAALNSVSGSSLLTVWSPPAIVTQPQSITNVVGTAASFSVTASGTAPLVTSGGPTAPM